VAPHVDLAMAPFDSEFAVAPLVQLLRAATVAGSLRRTARREPIRGAPIAAQFGLWKAAGCPRRVVGRHPCTRVGRGGHSCPRPQLRGAKSRGFKAERTPFLVQPDDASEPAAAASPVRPDASRSHQRVQVKQLRAVNELRSLRYAIPGTSMYHTVGDILLLPSGDIRSLPTA
jgi:hypothetical protein